MDVEFFVHGVPYSEDFWGKNEEKSYCNSFYDNSTDKLKYIIQVRRIGDNTFVYYNYLLYDSVVGNGGRAGSYFGMTLRFDAYCRDFMSIYRILDVAYNSYVLGKLLVADKTKLKYTAPSFAGFDMNGLRQKVFALLQDALTNNRFANIGSVSLAEGKYHKWNLYDCTEESVMADIRQYGKVALSPYYPKREESSMQQQCDSKIKAIQQQCNAQINEIKSTYEEKERTANATIGSLQNQITQLSTTVQQKESKIGELQQKVNELQNKLARERQNKDIDELIEQIKEPIKSLADILDSRNVVYPPKGKKSGLIGDYGDEHGSKSKQQLRKLYYIVGIIILVLVIVLAFFKFCGKKEIITEYVEQERTEQAGTYSNEKYAAEVETAKREAEEKIDEAEDRAKSDIVENPFSEEGTFDISQVKINIKEISSSNEKLNKGQTYTVEARHGSENGYWQVEGCTKEETEENNTIKITPTEEKVTVTYCVDGKNIQRTIEAV